ncbi:TPA: hypothetical protein OY468_002415 [Staphylococcus aureus]|nr:hypothetical protein [Staphylococcus aureus]HCX1922211.1 hypothetical protein [Staphylococcus aureus]
MAENQNRDNTNENIYFESFYLSNFKKFTRKMYRLGELAFPQPIKAKVFVIFITTVALLLLLRFIPFLNIFVTWIPFFVYYGLIPALVAYLLAEFKEEDRAFYKYFKSYIKYQRRKKQNEAYLKGEIIKLNEMKKEE